MKVKVSDRARKASKRFIDDLKSGKIKKDILPNNAKKFSGEKEMEDFVKFCEFAESSFYKELIER
jgi:hypothetical protein